MTDLRAKPFGLKLKRIPWTLYIMLIPGAIITLIYSYGPLLGLSLAFQKFNITKGLFGSPWVGLDNFRYIFKLKTFTLALRNTLTISGCKLVLNLAFPILVALLMNDVRHTRYKRTIQTMVYLPHFVSWIVLSGIFTDMLLPSTGIVNKLIELMGGTPVFFLGDKNTFPWTMIITDVWKSFGYNTILYMAALTVIDPALYEASAIDGANRLQQALHISIPGIVPIIVLCGTLSLGKVFEAGFDQIVNMYNTTVYETGDILDTLVYRVGIDSPRGALPRYDIATAIGLFKSVVSLILVSLSYYSAYKFADYRIF